MIARPANSLLNRESEPEKNPIWQKHTACIHPSPNAKPTGWLCMENRALPIMKIDLLEIVPGHGLHIRTRLESWLVSLPVELQSDELLKAITSGEVNSLSGSCEPYESLSTSSNPNSNDSDNSKPSVLEFE